MITGRIVFDLDGTLIDSAPDIQAVANELMDGEGLERISLVQTRSFVGNGARVFVQRLRALRQIPESDHERLYRSFVARYETAVHLTVPYPGVVEALTDLKARGHRLGLCTNKPLGPTQAVMRHLQLSDFFETVVGGDSLPVNKPDPAPLRRALDDLGGAPCVYVGDSDVDAETARRAGVPFLLFTEGYRTSAVEDLPHHARFSDFATLADLIQSVLQEPTT